MRINRMGAVMVLALSIAVPVAAQQAAPATQAQNVDPTGNWSLMFQAPQGPVAAQMIIKKDGDRFIGSIASDMGQAELEAAVKEKAVTVGFAMSGSAGNFNVVMNGTIDGDAIKGTFDAGGTTGEFSGTRAKEETKDAPKEPAKDAAPAAKIDMTGTWNLQIATETISASPTVTLKQDGEKLTGQYISAQYGAFPLTGSIKGDKFELNVPMSVEGNSLAVYFGGTIDKDSVKGTVAYGDFAQGTFTGSRKK